MILKIFQDKISLGQAAASQASAAMRNAISGRGVARIIAATGASQFEFLDALTKDSPVDWKKVEMFHLDEYIDLSADHPASFRKYLMERLIQKTGIEKYHLLDGRKDPQEVSRAAGEAITAAPIDVAFVGIGENSHLAFNDPPADLETEEPYIVVHLDEACRLQQVREGWFRDLSEVPESAISMSIRQILKATEIICIVPDARKARAVKASLEGKISPMIPASILRQHGNTTMYLDTHSAALLKPETIEAMCVE
ncbi:MAG TPA: glucosamine-6-phosphate deaminase [Acidobacteriota bacterium]|jgi:glucosamine-6-phosphate deaminase|nr:glucosamine-6-phosphate deaminase [Acidobacteriota bacterium]